MLFAQNNAMISLSKRHQCHQNCCLNKRFRTCNGSTHPEITKLHAFSFSPVKSPGVSMSGWGNNTRRGTWPVATASYHRPNHSSEFRIGSCLCPKTWLYRKTNVYQRLSHDQRIKIHHSCSCKQSVVHTRWRRTYLTIDVFKFTDVTASHV